MYKVVYDYNVIVGVVEGPEAAQLFHEFNVADLDALRVLLAQKYEVACIGGMFEYQLHSKQGEDFTKAVCHFIADGMLKPLKLFLLERKAESSRYYIYTTSDYWDYVPKTETYPYETSSIKLSDSPFGEHLVSGYSEAKKKMASTRSVNSDKCLYVTDKFKHVIEMAGLTGATLLPFKDTARRAKGTWYVLAITVFSGGRGVLHPWWQPLIEDRAKMNMNSSWKNNWRLSQGLTVNNRALGNKIFSNVSASGDALADNLLRLCSTTAEEITVRLAPRIHSTYICEEDFFVVAQETPKLGLSERAYMLLKEEKLINTKDFQAVRLVDGPIPEDLDLVKKFGPLVSPWTDAKIEEYLNAWWKHVPKAKKNKSLVKPIKLETLSQIIDEFRARAKDNKIGLSKLGDATLLKELAKVTREASLPIPEYWVALVKNCNGYAPSSRLELVKISQLAQFYKEKEEILLQGENYPPKNTRYLHVAEDGTGDWFSLEITLDSQAKQLPNLTDCPVVRFCHESYAIIESWPSIVKFLVQFGFYDDPTCV